MTHWAILTGEYPPQPGGVADYTAIVARGLASRGDRVGVYAPFCQEPVATTVPNVVLHRLPDHFGPRGLAELDRALRCRPRPERILVQYVPHAFGCKAMNLPFAAWLAGRARRIAPVWVMFHEVAFPFSRRPVKHAVLATVQAAMARLVATAAERTFVSIPGWNDRLQTIYSRMVPAEWLPVPCTFDAEPTTDEVADAKRKLDCNSPMIGHFGTFGSGITKLLDSAVAEFDGEVPEARIALIGRGSHEYRSRLVERHPDWAGRLLATGALPANSVSAYLRACSLLVQPFPDGISSRRTSAMAGLANGVPVVTNLGVLSESIWQNGGVSACPVADGAAVGRLAAKLLLDPAGRNALGVQGLKLYRDTFALEHTLDKLRGRP